MTPNGTLQKYDPKTGNIKILRKDMPSDFYVPTRVNTINARQGKLPNLMDFVNYSKKLEKITIDNQLYKMLHEKK